MSQKLATWLQTHREQLLERWLVCEAAPHAVNGNGAHPDEGSVLLASMYDGLITAALGDKEPLDACLRLARALRTHSGEDELSRQLALTFELRRASWDILLSQPAELKRMRPLIDELDGMIDSMALTLTNYWTTSANAVEMQLRQTELLATSLNEATEHADRIAVQLSNLNEIGRSLTTSLDPHQLLETVGARLRDVLETPDVAIFLADVAGALRVARTWGRLSLEPGSIATADDGDVVLRAFHSGEAQLEAQPDPAQQGAWFQPESAVLAVPLLAQEKTTGVITLQEHNATASRLLEYQSFVNSVASQAAMALQNARLYGAVRDFNLALEQRITERTRELQTERDMLEMLNQIGLEVTGTLDLDSLLQTCLDMLAKLVGVSHGSVMLIDPETDHLVDRAVLGQSGAVGYNRFPVGYGVVGWVAQHKKPALIADVMTDARWVAPPDDDTEAKQGGSIIAVPLIVHRDVMGVILLSHAEVGFFNEDHLRLLTASAGEIAMGINNALLYDQLQQQYNHQSELLSNEQRSAAQSSAILQSLSDGVIVCDAYGSVLAANPAASRVLDREVEELLTWRLPELLERLLGAHSSDIPVADLLARPLDARGTPRHVATTFQLSRRMISVSLDPVLMSYYDQDVLGAVAVFRDITREVESDRLKDEFIGTVSHELRTPMTSIKGYTQLMAMGSLGPLSDNQKEFLTTINQNAERMISIINDLLDITKIESGSVMSELDLRPLHLAEALSNVIIDLTPKFQERQQELTLAVPLGLPMIQVDSRRFNQIVHNLILNAIKYTPRQGKISIEAFQTTEQAAPEELRAELRPGAYVQVDVRDTGVGIAYEERERIFGRFYRTENPLKIEAGGTGLGLALVRPLVKLFGGRIWLTSEIGEGSTFSFIIPIA